MRSTAMIRTAKIGYIVLSVAIAALGLMMLIQPNHSSNWMGRAIGALMAVFGVIKLIGYYSRDLYRLAFQHDLALGILLIALGLAVLLKPGWAVNMLGVALGIEIVTEGLFRVQTSLDARRFGLESWWLIFALAIVTGGVGVALILWPETGAGALIRLLGASLLAEGLLDLCVALVAVKIIAHQRPEVMEI